MNTMMRIQKTVLSIAGLCLAVAQFAGITPARAAPVQFVKVCSQDGPGCFFIPGTDNCVDADQINNTQAALAAFSTTAFQGVAISTAIVAPYMPSNSNYAISVHWGGFEGASAVGFGGLMRVGNSNFFLSGGYGTGVTSGPSGQRAGFMFAW
jgi:hypothetical protein